MWPMALRFLCQSLESSIKLALYASALLARAQSCSEALPCSGPDPAHVQMFDV